MAVFSRLTAKVVNRSGAALLFLLTIHPGFSQKSSVDKVSIDCYQCLLSDVLAKIEKQSGLHFIYSTNKIQTDQRITLSGANQSVAAILRTLGRQTGFQFKQSGQYVIIKKDITRPPSTVATPPPGAKPIIEAIAPERNFAVGITVPDPINPSFQKSPPQLGPLALEKPPLNFTMYFDPTKLPALPKPSVRSLNLKNNHPGWFVSAGVALNNYSAGAEIQAGLRSIYLVYRPAWLNNGRYYGSYGVGAAMLLERNMSWNMSYTYGAWGNKPGGDVTAEQVTESRALQAEITSRHHAGRFMLKYAITPNISVAGGLSVNLLERRFEINSQAYAGALIATNSASIPITTGEFTLPYQRVIVRRIEPAPAPTQTRMWLGWETSLSYRFNFYKRR